MLKTHHLIALAAVVALAAPAVHAQQVPEAVKTAASATEKGLKKAEAAVVHAAKVASDSVQYGVGKANEVADNTARRLGLPTGPAPSPAPRSMVEAKR
jgi:hypothetical protein